MANSKKDEKEVSIFLRSFGLQPVRFKDSELKDGMDNPDFKVYTSDKYMFYCEVKSVFTEIGEDGIKHSKPVSILSAKARKAIKQFLAVNPDHSFPNVLVWVTHNPQIDFHTWIDFCKGKIEHPNPTKNQSFVKFNNLEPFIRVREQLPVIDQVYFKTLSNSSINLLNSVMILKNFRSRHRM